MKAEELFKNIELTKEQEEYIKKYLGIKDKKRKPEIGAKYFYIDSFGDIEQNVFGNDSADEYKILTNNMFKIKEDALFRLEQIKVYNELKNFSDENNEEIDWENVNTYKYSLTFNFYKKNIDIVSIGGLLEIGQIYFSSYELAEQAIEKVGADRIKKYLFGVE